MNTPQLLIQSISHGLRSYYKRENQVSINFTHLEYVNIIEHQNAIGRSYFARDRVSKQFIIVVQKNYGEISYKQKPSSWL